jgi:DNA-binding CsgD family transcriptional regulator
MAIKNTRALSHIRQLCCLGVESHSVIPAVTQALHELIPSSHNLFIWTDANGNVVDRYCEVYMPAVLEAASQNYAGKTDLVALARSKKAVGNMRQRPPEFYASPYFNEVYKPMRVRNSLDAVIRTSEGTQGILVMHRDSSEPFSENEQNTLEDILPYLRNIWTTPRNQNADVFTETADHGTIVCNLLGQIQYISTSASQLLLMAKTQGVLSNSMRSNLLPAELLVISQRLINVTKHIAHSSPPALQVRNRWGQFIFRAMWLDATGDSSDQLISINIWRQEPLAVSVVRGFLRSPLSPKQRDVALMLVVGRSAEEIVRELSITVTTYKDHLRKIYEKLGISKRADLIRHLTRPAMAYS